MEVTNYIGNEVEVRSSLIIDESSTKKIDKQNLTIRSGRNAPKELTNQVLSIVKSVLSQHKVIIKNYYGDQYISNKLVKFKYILTRDLEKDVADTILEILYLKLKNDFNIKQLTYLVPPKEQSFILIWM